MQNDRFLKTCETVVRRLTRSRQHHLRGRDGKDQRVIPNMIFFHIPKCGGASAVNALLTGGQFKKPVAIEAVKTRQFGKIIWKDFQEIFPPLASEAFYQLYTFKFREYVLLYYLACEYDFIHGHMLFSQHAYDHFKAGYRFITLVRDPVQRFISQYRYSSSQTYTFDEYLELELGAQQGSVMVQYFSGTLDKTCFVTNTQVIQAIENIQKFDVIGILEQQETLAAVFLKKFNVVFTMPHLNKNPHFALQLDPMQAKQVQKLCEPDTVLYQEILKRQMKA